MVDAGPEVHVNHEGELDQVLGHGVVRLGRSIFDLDPDPLDRISSGPSSASATRSSGATIGHDKHRTWRHQNHIGMPPRPGERSGGAARKSASMQAKDTSERQLLLRPRNGVLFVSGFATSLRVERGHLWSEAVRAGQSARPDFHGSHGRGLGGSLSMARAVSRRGMHSTG